MSDTITKTAEAILDLPSGYEVGACEGNNVVQWLVGGDTDSLKALAQAYLDRIQLSGASEDEVVRFKKDLAKPEHWRDR